MQGLSVHVSMEAVRTRTACVEVHAEAPRDWDEFVLNQPGAYVYHRQALVEVGRKAFGLRTFFLTARDSTGSLKGIIPLVEQSSMAFGRFLVSVPFFTYGGILGDDESIRELLRAVAGLARERRVRHVELRQSARLDGCQFQVRTEKVSMVLALPGSIGELSRILGSKLRSQIRRAERERIDVKWGGGELIPDFHHIFSRVMRDLGTPVYPRRFFEFTLAAAPDLFSVVCVRANGELQAAGILIRHGNRVEVPWAGSLPQAKKSAVNMRMYWEMLVRSIEMGASKFDFGRSTRDSGTYRFKAQWGAVPEQQHWYYWLPVGARIPILNASNPRFGLAVSIWKRLPLWAANSLGPLVIRNLP